MEVGSLKALGSFVIIKRLENPSRSSLQVVGKEGFSRGLVVGVRDEFSNLQPGIEIIYITNSASTLGLSFPSDLFVVTYDNIVAICQEAQS